VVESTEQVDLVVAERWIRSVVQRTGPLELDRRRPWATVFRVPLAEGRAWFKACRPVQAFEPRLTAELHRRWPGRVADVLAHDEARAWLLTADAGKPIEWSADAFPSWLEVLPSYAELQIGEADNVEDHLGHGVPDLRLETLGDQLASMLAGDLPLERDEVGALRAVAPRFSALCAELATMQPVATIQHDDLHGRSIFDGGDSLRVMDWGDASIGQPLFSLVRLDLSLTETVGTATRDRWFPRLRDAYLEPWGPGHRSAFDLAHRLGLVAHTLTWNRHRVAISAEARPAFDALFAPVLRRAFAEAADLSV
jgi:hypothetical protein